MTACPDTIHVQGDPVVKATLCAVEIEMIEDGLLVTLFHFILLAALLL